MQSRDKIKETKQEVSFKVRFLEEGRSRDGGSRAKGSKSHRGQTNRKCRESVGVGGGVGAEGYEGARFEAKAQNPLFFY